MSQNDLVIANQTFPNTRADINSALQALGSLSSGATEPATTYANMLWYDTSANILKMRAEANDAWISIGYLDQSTDVFRILDDTQVVNTSGTQTGLLGDQATATWEAGTSTTESLVSPAKVKAAVEANAAFSGLFMGNNLVPQSGTYIIPQGYIATVVAIGAGGGGGAASRNNDNASGVVANGGGAGGICVKKVDATSGQITITVAVGAGGASAYASASNAAAGGNGGTTTVTATGISLSASGGSGGTATVNSGTGAISAAAVSGGVASGGDININGGSVGIATKDAGTGAYGNGGATPFQSVSASSGIFTSQADNLTGKLYVVGVTDAALLAGRTNSVSSTASQTRSASGTVGGLGCGGGGAACRNNTGSSANAGDGGSGAVYISLEGVV
tara:strand:+ start:317 stop:1489 length:1173 start_codon:yes stop_codon:yes gene_type:complete